MDQKDLEELYQENKNFLFHKFLRLTNNPDRAYDLVQSVFLRLLEYSQRRNFEKINKNFLVKMGYNLYFSDFKREKKGSQIELNYSLEKELDRQIEKNSEKMELFTLISKEIENLDVMDRIKNSLKLRLLANENLDTIANVNNVSRRTTIRDLQSGLIVLRKSLVKKGILNDSVH